MKKSPIALDIRRMADGSTDALSHFYQATAPAAYALALSMLRSSDAAADAMQEVYLTAYETAADYSPRESALTWFLSLIYGHCRTQERITAEDIPADFTPVAALSLVVGLTPREISKITGLTKKEIPSPKQLQENTALAAFCQGLPGKTPELSQSIILSVLLSSGRPPVTPAQGDPEPTPKRPRGLRRKWPVYGLPALILAMLLVFAIYYMSNLPVATTIYLDGESSLCLELDKNDRVLDATACDDMGKTLLLDLNLLFSPVDTAMDKIADAMINEGYLQDHPNALLLSVSQDLSEEDSEIVLQKYQQQLLTALEQRNMPVVLLSQVLSTDERVMDIAETYGISPGKAGLVHSFLSKEASHTDPNAEKLAAQSPLYFYFLQSLQTPADPAQLHTSQTEKMSQYFSGEELLSRGLYLLTNSDLRRPGTSVTLSDVTLKSDEIQTYYLFSLNLKGETYQLQASARTGYLQSCYLNGERLLLNYYSDYIDLQAFIDKEKAISLAVTAAGCDADSVAFCRVFRNLSGLLNSSSFPYSTSSSKYPNLYQVTFYSEDLYTFYSVDVNINNSAVLNVSKSETPVLPGAISPRQAVSAAANFVEKSEDRISYLSYYLAGMESTPYYVVSLHFPDFHPECSVDAYTGVASLIPPFSASPNEAIKIAANQFNQTLESVLACPTLSVIAHDTFYRVCFSNDFMIFQVDVDFSNGQILQANSRYLITAELANMIVAEKAGISLSDGVITGHEITDSEYIIQLYYGNVCYVSRVCRNTGVILYFDVRSMGESLAIPQLPTGIRSREEALQIALEDAFATVEEVSQITINRIMDDPVNGDYYSIAFSIPKLGRYYTYSISTFLGAAEPVLGKWSEILYG